MIKRFFVNSAIVKSFILLLFNPTRADFIPAVRVDQENRPNYACYHPDIALGPDTGGVQPIYVVFEDDSVPFTVQRSDIAFQRSTDWGSTWLSENIIVRRGNRFACYPDLQVARDGTVYLVYVDRVDGSRGHIHFVRSSDMGETWSAPVQVDDNSTVVPVGWVKLALDTAGNLFCAWTDQRGSYLRVYADVSTDGGRSWGTDVRVDDDTVSFNCYPPDVFVQPGTNYYLVVADAPVRQGSQIVLHSHFYKSTDRGRSFSPGFQLDTFSAYSRMPHIVADEGHIITDYTGGRTGSNQCITMARTYFVQGDSWGEQVLVTELDTIYSSFTQGAKLAIDRQGTVHTALMIAERQNQIWNIYYTSSHDFGRTWQEREPVSLMPSVQQWDPSIAVDDNGCAYIVWQDMRSGKAEIWFATNRLTGIVEQEENKEILKVRCYPFAFKERTTINIPGLNRHASINIFDRSGRRIKVLTYGVKLTNGYSFVWDGRDEKNQQVPEGVYYIRVETAGSCFTDKVIRVK